MRPALMQKRLYTDKYGLEALGALLLPWTHSFIFTPYCSLTASLPSVHTAGIFA